MAILTEYCDFFIYASAAAPVFPKLFFASGNPTVAIIASLATYGVGYMAQPIGAWLSNTRWMGLRRSASQANVPSRFRPR